jgi:hypothetical protein
VDDSRLIWGQIIINALNQIDIGNLTLPGTLGDMNDNSFEIANVTWNDLYTVMVPENNTIIAHVTNVAAKWRTNDFIVKKNKLV